MAELTFDIIAKAWRRIINDPDKLDALQTQAPSLVYPASIRLKNIEERPDVLRIQFIGFIAASDATGGIPIIKRMIMNWVKQFAQQVQIIDGGDDDLNLLVSTGTRFTEAAISIYRRDPKTNKVKRAYKCLGGRKDGRRVSDPDQCLQFPDVQKKINLSITKRAKYGQSAKAKTKTKLTNIVARRVTKANQRVKKVRGI